jgi:hypothetical protein
MARVRPSSPPDPLDCLFGEAPALQTLRTQISHLARFDAEQLLSLAQREPDPARLMRAYTSVWTTLFQLGEFASARVYLEQAMALDDPTRVHATVVRPSNQILGASC